MKNLNSLITLPFVTTSEVVTRPGYHELTETYADFEPDLMDGFPRDPSRTELVDALRQLWRPFCAFKFATEHDRGAMLAAVIGSLARPGLVLAPGVLLDAPCPGSGKTLCAQAVGALVLGRRAPVTPFSGIDDAELKKVMVSNLLDGYDWLLLDNVVGLYDSAVMAAVLSSGTLRDRVLGSNTMFDGNVRLNVFMTSNNASLSRDLTSRFIRIRIDSGVERPQTLEFDFDPIERALSERLAIARAVCLVVQGFFAAGSPRLGKGDARFPEWSRLVRQCVLWCGQDTLSDSGRQKLNLGEGELVEADGLPSLAEEAGIGVLGDPAHQIIEEAGRSDPESQALGLLLNGLRDTFDHDFFYARDVLALIESQRGGGAELVREAAELLCPVRAPLNARTVASLLRYRLDRHCDGLVLRMADGGKNTKVYSVENA